jgi:excisionase family DNA binding protein
MKGENIETILYTVKEVAELLKTNVDYIHKLRKSGLLPFLKLGQYKVRRESLLAFLANYEGKDLTDPFNIMNLED